MCCAQSVVMQLYSVMMMMQLYSVMMMMQLYSVMMILCSERDQLVSQLSVMNVHVQQLTAREADAYQQVKACIELAEQSQMDMSQV